MSVPLRERDWFGNAYSRIAGAVSACVMSAEVVPDCPRVIEEQLERAYLMGLRDGRREAAL